MTTRKPAAQTLPKGKRIIGDDRATLAAEIIPLYTAGASIRQLAKKTGRSYGFIHRVLVENEVQLRAVGGAGRGAAKAS